MAVIEPAVLFQESFSSMNVHIVHWDNIANGDTCSPYDCISFTDKDVDINGTANGGTLAIHGANHPTVPVYAVVKDNADNEITGKTSGHYTVVNHVYSIKPILTGSGGSTDFNVTMILYIPV